MAAGNTQDRIIKAAVSGTYKPVFTVGLALVVLGALLSGYAFATGNGERFWHLFQVTWVYFTGLCGGSIALTAVHKIVKAKWSGMMIRFSQAAVAFAPVSLIGLVLIMTVGYEPIYGAMAREVAEQIAPSFPGKATWLSHGVMFARLGVSLSLLFWIGWQLIRADLLPDVFATRNAVSGARQSKFQSFLGGFDGSPRAVAENDARIYTLAPVYVVTYAIAFTFVAFDGIMALQPHWFSNLFGGWYFMASFLSAHTSLALWMIFGGKHLGVEDLISPKQRHDLGKLCFGFTVFWTYLMWAQFQVIYYANLPEETGFVFSRLWGEWRWLGLAVPIGMFIIPFAGLLGVAPKKNRLTLGFFATVSLTALFGERYLTVMPSITKSSGPIFGLPEAGPFFLMLGLYLFCYSLFARHYPMISPRLARITLDREVHHHEVEVFDHEDEDKDYYHEPKPSPA